jgi:hypothetical protein
VVDGSIVIVKTPDPVQFQAFMDLKDPKLDDMIVLGSRAIHYPEAGAYRALVAKRPGLHGAVAMAAARLAGVQLDIASGKS